MKIVTALSLTAAFAFGQVQNPPVKVSISRDRARLEVPSVTMGSLDPDDEEMPVIIDKGARGGPVDVFAFTLRDRTKTRFMLECESCLPRLVLQDQNGSVIKRDTGSLRAELSVQLDPGGYQILAGSFAGRGGAYALSISDGDDLSPTLAAFTATASRQKGTKTVKGEVWVRMGWDAVTLQDYYTDELVKSFRASDIVAINNATTHGTNTAGALLLGPGFSSQDNQWVTIRTKTESVALDVSAKQYPLIIAELERLTNKK